jgi:putative membrane protein
MQYLPIVLVSLVAIEHIYIMVLEMFLWTKPKGLKVFGNTQEKAEQTKVLAANQGLYNGFLAAGLFWGLLHSNAMFGHQIQLFFICCVIVAAIYGGLTAKRSILVVQGLPALLALTSLLFL